MGIVIPSSILVHTLFTTEIYMEHNDFVRNRIEVSRKS